MRTLLLVLVALFSLEAFAVDLPPCKPQFVNEVWVDQSAGTAYWCNGSSWVTISTGALDGGYVNLTSAQTVDGAKTFTQPLNSTYSGIGSTADGGANFLCNNNPASSSPCLANYAAAVEIGGVSPNPASGNYANVYLGSLNQVRDGGLLLSVLNGYGVQGSEVSEWQCDWQGNVTQNKNLIIGANGTDGRLSSNVGNLYLIGATNSGTGTLIEWAYGAGDVAQFYATSGGTEVLDIHNDGSIKGYSTKLVGTITLSTGSGTTTVNSGAHCVCSEATDATKTVKCAVASTTLTATGTGSDVISYICL